MALNGNRTLVNVSREPAFYVAGVTVKFISTPEDSRADIFVMEASILPSAFVPLHKHRDPEVFNVVDGTLEFYIEDGGTAQWRTAKGGDVINIPGDTKHAFRNATDVTVRTMAISGREIYQFFREIVTPYDPSQAPAPPSPNQMQKLFAAAAKYNYWMGSSEENAAIGIVLPPI